MLKKSIAATTISLAIADTMMLAFAQNEASFDSGHGALQRFDAAGIAATPLWVQIWLTFLAITFLSSLFFIRKHAIARWAIGGILLSVPLTPIIARSLGFPFLGGAIAIGHIVFWSPALVLLLIKRPFLDETNSLPYRIWSAAMTFVIAFSFIFDIRDSIIYIGHFAA